MDPIIKEANKIYQETNKNGIPASRFTKQSALNDIKEARKVYNDPNI